MEGQSAASILAAAAGSQRAAAAAAVDEGANEGTGKRKRTVPTSADPPVCCDVLRGGVLREQKNLQRSSGSSVHERV